MPMLIFVAIFMLICVVAFVQSVQRQRGTNVHRGRANSQSAAVAHFADEIGWTYSPGDPDNIRSSGFRLLQATGGSIVVNDFLVGERNGTQAQLFALERVGDHDAYIPDGVSVSTEAPQALTCLVMHFGANCPALRMQRMRDVMRMPGSHNAAIVEFESSDFNHQFLVRCEDERFAFSLLDAKVMEFLTQATRSVLPESNAGLNGASRVLVGMTRAGLIHDQTGFPLFAIEFLGPRMLVAVASLGSSPNPRWNTLVDFAEQFIARVPTVVYSTYPLDATTPHRTSQ